MNKKLVIANMPVGGNSCLCVGLFDGFRAEEVFLFPKQKQAFLGGIYVGIVEKVAENIGAAFVRTAPGQNVYLPLSDGEKAIYKTRKKNRILKPGDELLVQIEKEALKTKLPRASANLQLPGKYLVLTTGSSGLSFSRRLGEDAKKRIRKELPEGDRPFGIIVRTNAGEASGEEVTEELLNMEARLEQICRQGVTRSCGTCLYRGAPDWLKELSRIPFRELSEIVTDDPQVMESLRGYLSEAEKKTLGLKMYEDPLLPLFRLYSMEGLLEALSREKVPLKSGGSLVIQQTEAFAVIDVNTGKYDGKKSAEDTVCFTNLEAAAEAARQIRLRQLSGIILIDFINMRRSETRQQLLEEMRQRTAEDPVKTAVVDITPLDIMEITRQKERRSLKEQIFLLENQEGKEKKNGTDSL